MTKHNIRIKGLVSLMNHVREQLSQGIPAGEVDSFRTMVRDGIRTVEALCRNQPHHAGRSPRAIAACLRLSQKYQPAQTPTSNGSDTAKAEDHSHLARRRHVQPLSR